MSSQGLVSSGGRLVSLASPPLKSGKQWFVPVDFVGRALPLVLDVRAEFRRSSRTLIVGELVVPARDRARRSRRRERPRVTIDISPRTDHDDRPGEWPAGPAVHGRRDRRRGDAPSGRRPAGGAQSGRDASGAAASISARGSPASGPRTSRSTPAARASSSTCCRRAARPHPRTTAPDTSAGLPPAQPDAPPVSLFEGPVSGVRTIVIDPGHGGDETGAKGPGGHASRRTSRSPSRASSSAAIEPRLGLRVLLTRDGDDTVGLDERAALANNNKADLFVSLHANASVSPVAAGRRGLLPQPRRVRRAREARGRARRSTGCPRSGGGERQVELILWEMAQARHLAGLGGARAIVEQQLRARVADERRAPSSRRRSACWSAPTCPRCSSRWGSSRTPREEAKLASAEHQGQLVQALFESIVRFRTYIEGGAGRPSSRAGGPGLARRPALMGRVGVIVIAGDRHGAARSAGSWW